MKTTQIAFVSIAALVANVASANSVQLYDDTFSFFNGSTAVTSGTFNVLWGHLFWFNVHTFTRSCTFFI